MKQAIGHGKPVRLFLRDVSTMDESARALLGRLAAKGIHLSAAGVYSSYMVAEISHPSRGPTAANNLRCCNPHDCIRSRL